MKIFGYSLKSLIPGIVAAAVLGVAGASAVFAFVILGGLNLAATWPDPKPVYWVLHNTFTNSVAWRAPDEVPVDLDDPGRIALGAQQYVNSCAKCHGGPELGQNPLALAMRPRPQHLPSVVDQFTDAELFYILKSGVRMSAMPSWPTEDRDDEIWNVVAFIRNLPDMSAQSYLALLEDRELAMPERAAAITYGAPGPRLDNDLGAERYPADEYAYSSPATEWRDFAIQGDVVQRCAACHGGNGGGEATLGRAPNLTVLSADYITEQLTDYASGERKSGIMQIVASNLSQGQREALGKYYDALPDVAPTQASLGDPQIGEDIATGGKLMAAVPSCVTCHNNAGVGDDAVAGLDVPNLAGQSAPYIRDQLRLFAAGVRQGGAAWKPMQYIASNLTEEEIDGLAAWFSQQEPGAQIERRDLLASARPSDAAGVVEQVCKECHTVAGIGSPSGDKPNLTLQSPDYIHQQLWKFREDIRPSSQMGQTATKISEQDIANVAAYFGALPPVAVVRDVDAAAAQRGAAIAQNGLPDVGVPSCVTCHGSEPTQEIEILPRLNGQNYAYLKERLDQFAGERGENLYALSPMNKFASRMTDEQRDDVAAWFSTQEPLAK